MQSSPRLGEGEAGMVDGVELVLHGCLRLSSRGELKLGAAPSRASPRSHAFSWNPRLRK